MSPSRPLLRLDEKVAAETRRLAALGRPPGPAAVATALLLAAALHAALAALPLPAARTAPPALTPPPDLPTVWRWGPPAPAPPPVGPAPASAAVAQAAPGEGQAARPAEGARLHVSDPEPVPEPPPEVPAIAIPADVDAVIPAPAPLPDLSGTPEESDATPAGGSPDAVPVTRVNPVYPIAARSMRAEGSVALHLTVRPDGSVEDAVVTRCTRPGLGFEDAALAAVRRWRFAAVPGGDPRSLTVHVDFKEQEVRP